MTRNDELRVAAASAPHVLLVSDNRDNPNWGSRSTTMALIELLDGAGLKPSDRMLDTEVRTDVALAYGAVSKLMLRRPVVARLASAGLVRGGRTRLVLERMLGIREAVSDDPEETVRRWRRSGHEPIGRWIDRVERSDALIINGEGSMIFTTPSRIEQRFHLALMQLAHEADVPFAYVNALVADPAKGPRNDATFAATGRLLPHARLVTTRDLRSLELVRAVAPRAQAVHVPDAVFVWNAGWRLEDALLDRTDYLVPFHGDPEGLGGWDFRRPYICIGGSSEAAKDLDLALISYRRLLKAVPELGYAVVVVQSSGGDTFLEDLASELGLPLVPSETNVKVAAQILGHAELVITGRYHAAILAGLSGVPCVMLGADSHKTESVQEMLGYPHVRVHPEQPSESDVGSILDEARAILADRARWRAAISAAVSRRAVEAKELVQLLAERFADVRYGRPLPADGTGKSSYFHTAPNVAARPE